MTINVTSPVVINLNSVASPVPSGVAQRFTAVMSLLHAIRDSTASQEQSVWVQIPAPPSLSCVTWGKP